MTELMTSTESGSKRSILPLMLSGWIAVIIVDTGGSLVSVRTGFAYGYFAILSIGIYAIIGISARARGGSVMSSAVAGFGVALFDATVGWAVSWAIGPGSLPTTTAIELLVVLLTFNLVVAVDTSIAIAAGAASHAITVRRRPRK